VLDVLVLAALLDSCQGKHASGSQSEDVRILEVERRLVVLMTLRWGAELTALVFGVLTEES
jgi:hypothetical protein